VFLAGGLMLMVVALAAQEAGSLPDPVGGDAITRIVIGLGLVLFAIMAMAWAVRRVFRIQPDMQGQLKVLAGVSMGPRERVVLLQAGSTQLLLAVVPGRIQTLHVLEHPVELAAHAAGHESKPSTPFRDTLERSRRGGRVHD
jgi:flagellar protein FliO/FliZ